MLPSDDEIVSLARLGEFRVFGVKELEAFPQPLLKDFEFLRGSR